MRLNSFSLAVFVLVILFGGIGFSSAMNWWQTETSKEPVRYTEGEAAGEYNPADIRGSYSFGEVSELFGVPLPDLQVAFRIPADSDPGAYQLKLLEEQFADLPVEIGTDSVRMFVAFYKGLPYELTADEDTYLFAEAVAILEQQGRLTSEQSAYLGSHTAPAEMASEAQSTATTPEDVGEDSLAEPTETVHEPEEYLVTGKTSFQDLLDWGVPGEAIQTILGEAMPAPQTLVKDYASSKGIAFSDLKGQLQVEVDQQR